MCMSMAIPQEDGSFIINGSASIRDLNKTLGWTLPTEGPKTLNGLIMESLESIPDASVSFKIDSFYIETLQTKDNIIKTARIIEIGGKNKSPPT